MKLYDTDAWVYDLAFSWDIDDEVDWLIARLGEGARTVLEPGCGSGRLFPAFARRGLEAAGVDRSAEMLARCRSRMRAAHLPEPALVRADMADFALGRRFAAAICPISTFGYLLTDHAADAHLACMARHLHRGSRYLIQLGLRPVDGFDVDRHGARSLWTVEADGHELACAWSSLGYDGVRHVERQIGRFEFISGPRAGTVVESVHEARVWDWTRWSALIGRSPFRQVAAWDGNSAERTELDVDPDLEGKLLTWHELAVG